jgi:murein DD-endopeptidase MepM/ murein hydrolase activator NlpD
MPLQSLINAVNGFFGRWFHQRNIIVVSKHKVKHISIGALPQFCVLALVATCLGWASYSTGSYFAVRHAFNEQGQTLRSVAGARVDSMGPLSKLAPPNTELALHDVAEQPLFTVSALNENRMTARMAQLEQQVAELQNANAEIIQRVREKTAGNIDSLESIIRATGLNPQTLKKQYGDKQKDGKAQGGPYIPDDLSRLAPQSEVMFSDLDKLALLRTIIGNLPITSPIKDGRQESPFGHRIDPFTGHLAFHAGIDLSGEQEAGILATADGKVVAAGRNGAYGKAVDIDHGYGIVTRYGHMSKILVEEEQIVRRGEIIGLQGSTGRSTGAHLHYEVRYNDQPMNPKNFLNAGEHVLEN